MISPEVARDTARKYWGWGLAALAVVLAPTIYTLAMGVVEMIWALALAAGSVLLIWMISPALLDYMGNKRMELVKAAAEANPIETMDGIIIDKTKELSLKEDAVVEVNNQYLNVKKMIDQLRQTDPVESKSYAEIADQLKLGLDEMQSEYNYADAALSEYRKQRDKAKRLWTVAQAINKALAVSASARSKVFQDIKSQVAFDTVTGNLNKAFSRLNMAVEKHKNGITPPVVEGEVIAPKALTEGPISVTSINDLHKVKEQAH